MSEHRFTIPCELDPDDAEHELRKPLSKLEEDGWELIAHIETVGFFGWTCRAPDERAVGVSVPQAGGPARLLVRSEHEDLAQRVVDALVSTGPLEGCQATPSDRDRGPVRGPA